MNFGYWIWLFAFGVAGCGRNAVVMEPQSRAAAVARFEVADMYADEPEVDARYVINGGDEITIHAPDMKEMNEKKYAVGPDGKCCVAMLGEVSLTEKTVREVEEELTRRARKYYSNPQLRITVVACSK